MPETELERFHRDLGQSLGDVRLLRRDGETFGDALKAAADASLGYLVFRKILKTSEAGVSAAVTTLKLSENVAPLKGPSVLLKDVLEVIQPKIVKLKEATDKVQKLEPLLRKISRVDDQYEDNVLPVLINTDSLLSNLYGGTTEVVDAFQRLDTPDGNPVLDPNASDTRPGREGFTGLVSDVSTFLAPTDVLLDPILVAGQEYQQARGQLDALLENLDIIDFPGLNAIFGRFLEFEELFDFLGPILEAVQVALLPIQPFLAALDAATALIVDPVVDYLKDKLEVDKIFEELAAVLDPLFPLETMFDNLIAQIDQLEAFLDAFSVNFFDIPDFAALAEEAYGRFEQAIETTELAALSLIEGIPMRLGDTEDETMWGLGGDEVFDPREGDDLVLANTGNDIIVASAGDDTIRGGAGTDRVVFAGELAEYDFARDDETGEFIFTHTLIGQHGYNEGSEVISEVEYFDFGSNTYDFDFFNTAIAEPSPLIGTDGDDAIFLQRGGERFDGLLLDGRVFDGVYYAKGEFGNDLIYGTIEDDYLRGQEGDDVIIPRTGTDAVDGGDGVDTYQVFGTGTNSDHNLDLLDGISRYAGERDYLARIENIIIQHSGNQNVFGDVADNIIYSGGGSDVLSGREGNDRLYGNDGNDVLVGGLGVDQIYGGAANDFIAAWNYTDDGPSELYDGEAGLDTLSYATGSSGRTLFFNHLSARGGLPGIDKFETSGGGSVIIRAGEGQIDRLAADGRVIATDFARNIERFIGSNGNDTLFGFDHPDVNIRIDGGAGDDVLYTWGVDIANGGAGDDLFVAAPSLAGGRIVLTIDGDMGTDAVTFEEAGDFRFVLIAGSGQMQARVVDKDYSGRAIDAGGSTFIIRNVRDFTLGDNDDYIAWGDASTGEVLGGSGNDTFVTSGNFRFPNFYGETGNDLFELRSGGNAYGGAGNDRIELYSAGEEANGDAGDDTFLAVGGRTTISGGEGYDKLILQPNSNAGTRLDLTSFGGTASFDANNHMSLLDLFEEYVGGSGRDTFNGSFYDDRLILLDGDDTVRGLGGNDQIFGGNGADDVDGGAGDDLLSGGSGNDTINGGSGNDTVIYTLAGPNGPEGEVEALVFAGAIVDLAAGTGGRGFEADQLFLIENVYGTHLNDRISGNGTANVLFGGDGADTLNGAGGDDILVAGTSDGGVDRLIGGDGNDRLVVGTGSFEADGGNGSDTLDFSLPTDPFLGGGRTLALDIDLQERILVRRIETSELVWKDDQSIDARFWDGEVYTPEAVLRADVNYARAASDLALRFPDEDEILAEGETREALTDAPSLALDYVTTTTVVSGQGDFDSIEGVIGSIGDDLIRGTDGANNLRGGDGDDVLEGRGGIDTLDGGDGVDRGLLSGERSDYTIILQDFGNGFDSFLQDRSGQGGNALLRDTEVIDFGNPTGKDAFDLRVFGGMDDLSEAALESFVELYIAYFNRAPDALGLNFWGTAFANGLSLSEIAAYFIDQDETRGTYPEGSTALDFVTQVYDNVLGRVPDQIGLDFWTGVLNSGAVTRDQFILQVLDGAKADPPPDALPPFVQQQEADQEYLSSKVDIGVYFSIIRGISNVGHAVDVMNTFDGSSESIEQAAELTDMFYDAVSAADGGELIIQLVGAVEVPFDF
jgi:Ca2+-binding RTX toxin-like protein